MPAHGGRWQYRVESPVVVNERIVTGRSGRGRAVVLVLVRLSFCGRRRVGVVGCVFYFSSRAFVEKQRKNSVEVSRRGEKKKSNDSAQIERRVSKDVREGSWEWPPISRLSSTLLPTNGFARKGLMIRSQMSSRNKHSCRPRLENADDVVESCKFTTLIVD